jgi:hypothetical protein
MFDGVSDVDFATINVGLFETFIEQYSRRADKGSALSIFSISGLFTYHHDGIFHLRGFGGAFQLAEDCLCSVAIKIATTTFLYRLSEDR